MTRSNIGKQIMVTPTRKPKRKPSNKDMVESGNRMAEMESKAKAAMKKDQKNKAVAKKGTKPKPNNYKCGGKVKRSKS